MSVRRASVLIVRRLQPGQSPLSFAVPNHPSEVDHRAGSGPPQRIVISHAAHIGLSNDGANRVRSRMSRSVSALLVDNGHFAR